MKIEQPTRNDYDELTDLWEASVRATHDFLGEEDIRFFRPLVREQYLDAVSLYVVRNSKGRIVAFMGIDGEMLEMLFVHPEVRGKGLGTHLVTFAVHQKNVCKVDVNEQNRSASDFYKRMGFELIGRDETDAQGKPFPILHLYLKNGLSKLIV